MAEKNLTPIQDVKQDAKSDTATDRIERDWFLQRLVGIVNGTSADGRPINLPITLLSGGAAITGQLISHKAYFERFATIFGGTLRRAGDTEKTAAQVTKLFSEMGDFAAMRTKLGIPQPEVEPPPQYIHLANASIVHQNGLMPGPETPDLVSLARTHRGRGRVHVRNDVDPAFLTGDEAT